MQADSYHSTPRVSWDKQNEIDDSRGDRVRAPVRCYLEKSPAHTDHASR
jgi:hypothetical protein